MYWTWLVCTVTQEDVAIVVGDFNAIRMQVEVDGTPRQSFWYLAANRNDFFYQELEVNINIKLLLLNY